MVCFFASRSLIQFVQYTIPPPAASLIDWLFILGYTDCNTVPTWWMYDYKSKEIPAARDCTRRLWKIL